MASDVIRGKRDFLQAVQQQNKKIRKKKRQKIEYVGHLQLKETCFENC